MILLLLNRVLSLISALVPFLMLVYIAVRHQRVFLTLFMFLTAFESTRDFAPSVQMIFSGVHVYPEDLVMVVCAGAAVFRMGQWRLRRVTRTPLLVLAALASLGVISWISTYGLQVGTNSWRDKMLIIALLAYATTRPRAWSWNDLRVFIVAPAIVVALASLLGGILYGFGSSSSAVEIGGLMEGGRPVSASGSLLMLIGLWVTVFSPGLWSARRALIVLLLGSMVLLTQNRSVWVASILGAVVWWLAPRIRLRGTSSGLGGLSRTVLFSLFATVTAVVGSSVAALGQSAGNDGTWVWRVDRWTASMTIPRSWLEWLVGSAFGPTPASTPNLFATTAHSTYVNAIEMTGFIGLAGILFLVVAAGRALVRPSIEPIGLVVCLTVLSYGVAYQLPAWAYMVTGVLLASTQNRRSGDSPLMTGNGRLYLLGTANPEEHLVDQASL